jgi:hypothetical protein
MIDQPVGVETSLAWLSVTSAADRPADPGRTAGVGKRARGYDESMLVDVVAVLVLVLMAADVFRMLFVDTKPQRDIARRDDR